MELTPARVGPVLTLTVAGSGDGGSGWIPVAAEITSQPVGSSWSALRKASRTMASALATSAVTTVNAMVARTQSAARRNSEAIFAEAIAGSAVSARALSKSARTAPQARQPLRHGTVSRTA